MKSITVYGIPNCDTVKKARAWLDARGVDYTFHDFKKQGLPAERVEAWLSTVGWETLLNRKGTSWRKLDDAVRDGVMDAPSAMQVMQQQPSVVKRPVVDWPSITTVGFDAALWEQILLKPV